LETVIVTHRPGFRAPLGGSPGRLWAADEVGSRTEPARETITAIVIRYFIVPQAKLAGMSI
jgi:hypothetical protein